VIVVSEERGAVSVAEAGRLKQMASAAALKNRLEKFLESKFPQNTPSAWRRYVAQHGRLKVLAITLAVVAWFVLAYDPSTIQRTFVVPVEYRNLPKHLMFDHAAPNEARITLSGSERNFRFLEPGSLKITVDLTEARDGRQEITVSDANVRLPTNLALYRIEPRVIRLHLHGQSESSPKDASRPKEGEDG
jgi:hypothetical protein